MPLSPVQTLVCGFGGIILPKMILAPFDSLKLFSQIYGKDSYKYLMEEVKVQGFPSLYNGVVCDILRIPTQSLLHYILFNQMRNRMNKTFADSIAATVSATFFHPLDVIQTLMISNPAKYPTIPKTVSRVIKKNGLSGLYRGLTPTLVGFVPYRTVQLGAHFLLKRYSVKNTLLNEWIVTGAVTGAAQFFTYPFDIVRKRMICDESLRGKSMITVFKETHRNKGFRGFYEGFGISFLKTVPLIWLQEKATKELTTLCGRFNYLMCKHHFQ